jgi:UPF0042 nucleotide-binding protein
MSGAGKTNAMNALEDLGFFCIDNLPPTFLPQLADLYTTAVEQGRRVAVAMDARGQGVFADVAESLNMLQELSVPHQVLFLDCADDILIRRFSETRRRHPLGQDANLSEQIARERRILADVRDRADLIMDTSLLKPAALKERLALMITGSSVEEQMAVEVVSFGFKHGVPLDADLLIDVRFLPNPFYDPVLRPQTGLDKPVADYVLGQPEAGPWLKDTVDYLKKWLPAYARTGRSRLSIAIGCTGGQHRSVALAEAIGAALRETSPAVTVRHRDLKHANRGAAEALTAAGS